jgi:hypothetical protein
MTKKAAPKRTAERPSALAADVVAPVLPNQILMHWQFSRVIPLDDKYWRAPMTIFTNVLIFAKAGLPSVSSPDLH